MENSGFVINNQEIRNLIEGEEKIQDFTIAGKVYTMSSRALGFVLYFQEYGHPHPDAPEFFQNYKQNA